MLLAILNCCTEEELEETTDEEEETTMMTGNMTEEEMVQHRDAIKNKVLAVGRMARVFDLLRYDSICPRDITESSWCASAALIGKRPKMCPS